MPLPTVDDPGPLPGGRTRCRYRLVATDGAGTTIARAFGSQNLLALRKAVTFDQGMVDGTVWAIAPKRVVRQAVHGMGGWSAALRDMLGGDEAAEAFCGILDRMRRAKLDVVVRNDGRHATPDEGPAARALPKQPRAKRAKDAVPAKAAAEPEAEPIRYFLGSPLDWRRIAREALDEIAEAGGATTVSITVKSETRRVDYLIEGDAADTATLRCRCRGDAKHGHCKHLDAVVAVVGEYPRLAALNEQAARRRAEREAAERALEARLAAEREARRAAEAKLASLARVAATQGTNDRLSCSRPDDTGFPSIAERSAYWRAYHAASPDRIPRYLRDKTSPEHGEHEAA